MLLVPCEPYGSGDGNTGGGDSDGDNDSNSDGDGVRDGVKCGEICADTETSPSNLSRAAGVAGMGAWKGVG